MIGKYQNTIEEINVNYVIEKGVKVVRRITGGGAIYTDLGGWQFSFITRGQADHIDFGKYMTPVTEALKTLEINAEFNSRNDLVINGKKISGNAQCMLNGYTLHHGSLLFNTDFEEMVRCLTVDSYKIISKGIKSVKERVTNISEHLKRSIDIETFKQLMITSIRQGSDEVYTLTDVDIMRIKEIAKDKFESWDWNFGKSPKFNITRTGHFDGGKIDFRLDVNGGVISDCRIYGDFFGCVDIDELSKVLVGTKYKRENIQEVIDDRLIKKGLYNIDTIELVDLIC
ncbi:Lipoate-protein ligase LplJ [anaerobic digester metagenome]